MLGMIIMFLEEDIKPQDDLILLEFWNTAISFQIQGKPWPREKRRCAFVTVSSELKRRPNHKGETRSPLLSRQDAHNQGCIFFF